MNKASGQFLLKTSLNTSTLLPYKLGVIDQAKVAAEAGYSGIELWMRDIEAYMADGGTTGELHNVLVQSGLAFINTIAFFKWCDRDPVTRAAGFEQAEREMSLLAELGCQAIAAPPFGDVEGVTLEDISEQFARLHEIGRQIGVEPYLEFWGRAKQLYKLEQAIEVLHRVPDGRLLLDPFHLYVGGSDLERLKSLKADQIGLFHVNDYPADPPRATIRDRDRIFPDEGIAPSGQIAAILEQIGYRGYVSLELFQEDYGGRSAFDTAKAGLEAVKRAYRV